MRTGLVLSTAILGCTLSASAFADFRADYRLLKGAAPAPLQSVELSGSHLRTDSGGSIALIDADTGRTIVLMPAQRSYIEPDVVMTLMPQLRQTGAVLARQQLEQMDDPNRTAANFGNKLTPMSVAIGLLEAYEAQKRVKFENAARPGLEMMAHGGPHGFLEVRTRKQAQGDSAAGIDCDIYRQSTNGEPSYDMCFVSTDKLGLAPADARALAKALALQARSASTALSAMFERESHGDRLPDDELLIKLTHYDSDGQPILVEALDRLVIGAQNAADFAIPAGYTDLGATLRQSMQALDAAGMNGKSPR
ncbi:MAG TPA: hypothetical protein VL425_11015 [Rudaea sp.]|jgi:hypothetical protein|nr:hypothetical protein [Rudaea sp.]